MSRQQSFMPEYQERDTSTKHKKRTGSYEIWMKFTGKDDPSIFDGWSYGFMWRSYETRDIAEKNLQKLQRKHGDDFILEIRENVKND